ncbi:NAD-dependent deacylase [Roseivirga sp. BDSF3-8]|uniref:SIR2 family NAD-dependent protein deacylase n=1 Tax=Roseivirga sp. BDSF3-8 TaxID=3241598 RepID=UPI00353212FD
MKNLVVLSGAGISAESGIPTFRDANGLWEGHDVMEVASPQGWKRDPELVLDFYNQRRKAARKAEPNEGHKLIASLEEHFEVQVITQNIDNLHERAGSTKVLHLHGEIFKCRSSLDEHLVYDMEGDEIMLGDKCEKGSQLRPHIVWFGEMVPMMEPAAALAMKADVFVVVGTSLVVYPAAGLVDYTARNTPIFVVDPNVPEVYGREDVTAIQENASTGMKKLKDILLERYR